LGVYKEAKAIHMDKQPSTQEIDELNAQARHLREPDSKQALETAQRAHDLAKAVGYELGVVESLVNLSHSNNWLGNFATAYVHASGAVNIAGDWKEYSGRGDLLYAITRCHNHLANYSEATD
jgi:hypothetical protein